MINQVSFLEPIEVQELMDKNLAYVIDGIITFILIAVLSFYFV